MVKHLWRYPVKSLLGESCQQLTINSRGVEGDRFYAVTDVNGKFGSGKNTRRFTKINHLFDLSACYHSDEPVITFPDGQTLGLGDETDQALSQYLGQNVTLQAENQIPHFDAGAIHIVTSGAIQWLQAQLPHTTMDERRFRPNLVLQTDGVEPVEHHWLGKIIEIGEVKLEVTEKTRRCLMTGFKQHNLPDEPEISQFIDNHLDSHFGVYARVIEAGVISKNDVARLV